MKIFLLSIFLAASATASLADTAAKIAVWSENSGSLPPEYAWKYSVEFYADGRVQAIYCKGYANEAPGCATVSRPLSAAAKKTMSDAIAPYAQDLLDHPPQRAADDEIPIGGGSVGGLLVLDDTSITLPHFPQASDVARVQAVLKILQDSTPANLVKKAKRRAKQP